MTKYTVKTVLNSVIQDKDGQFTYDQKLVSMKWTEEKERKKYQLGYGNESPSPILKEFLNTTTRNPRESQYVPHVIEPYNMDPDFGPDQLKDE